MRWIFPDPNDREETAAREAVRGRIDAWWKAFTKTRLQIDALFSGRNDFDLVDFMGRTLQSIDQSLAWEFGPALNGSGHRLAICPEAEHHLHPMTDDLLARAPKLKDFEFYHGRPPEDVEGAKDSVEARVGADIRKGSVRIDIGEMNRIDVSYFFPQIKDADQARNAAFITSESLFGERCMDSWAGVIEAWPRPEGDGWMPLESAAEAMKQAIDAVQESLPDGPWSSWINNSDWTALSMKADADREPDPHRFGDLITATVSHTEFMMGILRGTLFHSPRYSRHGEKFCYLKLDETEFQDNSRFDFRRPAEDSLDQELQAKSLGCIIGGGTGVWFGYCLLALTDVKKAIPVIRKVLREHKAHTNSWLLFLDYDWCAEWVGIWDDTPPPP